MTESPLVKFEDVSVAFGGRSRRGSSVLALDSVSAQVESGESVGVVGESGSGKTTLGRVSLGLIPPSSGVVEVQLDDGPVHLNRETAKPWHERAQLVFQDPLGSFNPRRTLRSTIVEAMRYGRLRSESRRDADARLDELFERVGLHPEQADRRPNQLSGGQLQRASIARALSLHPSYIVCDEPTSALDASIRAGVIDLLCELRERLALTYLFISHDLGVVRAVADRVLVLYRGRVVETGTTRMILEAPRHPYTVALLSAVLDPIARTRPRARLVLLDVVGVEPGAGGCVFRDRCQRYLQLDRPRECGESQPELVAGQPGHAAACHFPAVGIDAVRDSMGSGGE